MKAVLRLGLNAVQARGLGSSAVVAALLKGLSSVEGGQHFSVWLPKGWRHGDLASRHLAVRYLGTGTIRKLWVDNVVLRRAVRSEGVDVLLSLCDTAPPHLSVPSVLFVQQAYLAYPEAEWGFRVPPLFAAKMRAMAIYFRSGLRSVDRFIVQTHHMRSALSRRWGIPEGRIAVVPTPVPLPHGVSPLRKREESVLVVLGRAPHKNKDLAERLVAKGARAHPDVTWYVGASPTDVPRLARRAAESGTFERFKFLAGIPRREFLRVLARCRVCMIPSKLESYGLSFWEALALEVPIVASDREFAREICGDAALYANSDDEDAWLESLQALLTNKELWDQQRQRAVRRHAEIAIEPQEIARRFLNVVEEVVR